MQKLPIKTLSNSLFHFEASALPRNMQNDINQVFAPKVNPHFTDSVGNAHFKSRGFTGSSLSTEVTKPESKVKEDLWLLFFVLILNKSRLIGCVIRKVTKSHPWPQSIADLFADEPPSPLTLTRTRYLFSKAHLEAGGRLRKCCDSLMCFLLLGSSDSTRFWSLLLSLKPQNNWFETRREEKEEKDERGRIFALRVVKSRP
jgi:hypothetical protein